MNSRDPDDACTFRRDEADNAWAAFERIHYLRQLAHNIQQHLEELYQHPYRNAERIAQEQIALENIQQELLELEPASRVY